MSGGDEVKQSTPEFDGKTRYDWNNLSDEQQDRIIAAIQHMGRVQNVNGTYKPTTDPSTSQLWYVSSYHFNPTFSNGRSSSPRESQGEWCYHRDINFPMWHRIYIHIFEKMLQKADKDLGNDGKITLPFWRWDQLKTYPDDIYTKLRTWEDLGGTKVNYWDKRYAVWRRRIDIRSPFRVRRLSPEQVQDKLDRNDNQFDSGSNIVDYVRNAFNNHDFTTFAHDYRPGSIELPHGAIHVAVSGLMEDDTTAAYDPVFFFHHCNVDRLYEAYITNTNPNSLNQFLSYVYPRGHPLEGQSANVNLTVPWQDQGRTELVGILKRQFKSEDCFKLEESFGAKYETLDVDLPERLLLTAPTYVIIPGVRAGLIKGSFVVHILLVPNEEIDRFQFNSTNIELNEYYAGSAGMFSGGKGCKNCETQPPIKLYVNVSRYLQKRGLSRHNVTIKGYLFGNQATEGQYVPLYLTHFDNPKITGPVFEDIEEDLSTKLNDKKLKKFLRKHRNDIKGLKIFLKNFGYLDENQINDIYDNKTIEAVKAFQKANNLKETGIANKLLKKYILQTKRCGNLDGFVKHNKLKDDEIVGVIPSELKNKTEITYTLINSPSYLKRNKVLETLKDAFQQWSLALAGKLKFKYIEYNKNKNNNNNNKIDIEIDFNQGGTRDDKDKFLFDGEGGILGHGGNGYVYFDKSEKWEINEKLFSDLNDKKTWFKQTRPNISLPYVALHEIGHALGLDHSNNYSSVMSPVYSPKIDKLTKDDLKRIGELYQLY